MKKILIFATLTALCLYAAIDIKTLPVNKVKSGDWVTYVKNDLDSMAKDSMSNFTAAVNAIVIKDSLDDARSELKAWAGAEDNSTLAAAKSNIHDSLTATSVIIPYILNVRDTLFVNGSKVRTFTTQTVTRLGYRAGLKNTTGYNNTYLGYAAGSENLTGSTNTFIGSAAGTSSTGSANTIIGYQSGNQSTGSFNCLFGQYAGAGSAGASAFIGVTAAGYKAGFGLLTAGAYNAFFGYFAGAATTTGSKNTFVGDSAGVITTIGSKNICIGRGTNPPLNSTSNYLNIGNKIKGNMDTLLNIYPKVAFKDSSYLSNGKEIRTQINNSLKAYPDSLYKYYFPRNTEKSYNVLMLGSSITWGNGNINDTIQSGTGFILKDMIKRYANGWYSQDLKYPQGSTTIRNDKYVTGFAKQISALNSTITFYLYGNEINIGYIMKRTSDYATVTVTADGSNIIGKFTNKNNTLGTDSNTFIADGVNNRFLLNKPYTYGHQLSVNSTSWSTIIHSGDISAAYEYDDGTQTACIVRGWDSRGNVKHWLVFETVPTIGDTIQINYNYGKLICVEGSTVGQTTADSLNESNYGIGGTSWNPLAPTAISSGLEFRDIDQRAVWSYKFSGLEAVPKLHKYTITITGGTNPYFAINYVSNRNHYLVNAGIGGFDLPIYLSGTYPNISVNKLLEGKTPDIIMLQPGCGSDATYFQDRVVKRLETNQSEATAKAVCTRGEVDSIKYISPNNFTIRYCSGLIDSISNNYLVSHDIFSSDSIGYGTVAIGNIVRIGKYHGEYREVQTREVSAIDVANGKILWKKPIFASQFNNIDSLPDLIGKEFLVRDLSLETALTDSIITFFKDADPMLKVCIVTSENSNYFMRSSWGYDIAQKKASIGKNDIEVINMSDYLQEKAESYISGHTAGTELSIAATGATTYNLGWTGEWQGFAVYVNDVNVYGKDCYVKIGKRYGVNPAVTGAGISITMPYSGVAITEELQLVFYKNVPASGTFRVQRADYIWGGDLTHPNCIGGKWYSEIYLDKIFK